MNDLVILGAGGHARVLLSALQLSGYKVVGCLAEDVPDAHWPREVEYLGPDSVLRSLEPERIKLVNGIGGIGNNDKRQRVFERAKAVGFDFHTVVHPRALLADDVRLGEGVVVMMGAILQVGCVVGPNATVNTGAIIDHDCRIGAHAHIAPGVCLSGAVHVGDGAHIGTGAAVIQGIRIGVNALVAAGCVVVRDIPAGAKVKGVPARLVDR